MIKNKHKMIEIIDIDDIEIVECEMPDEDVWFEFFTPIEELRKLKIEKIKLKLKTKIIF
jgi:hypothetical protein